MTLPKTRSILARIPAIHFPMKIPARFPLRIARLRAFLFAAAAMLCLPALHAQVAGTLDAGYNPNVTGTLPSNYVLTTAVQPDGKTIIGGSFTAVGGASHVRLARLNADGSADASFIGSAGDDVDSVAVQTDGKVLIGGAFTTVKGIARSRIARFNADGSLESTATFNISADGVVHCVVVQADGKILIGGEFTFVNGVGRNRIARLNADGSLESTATFNPGSGVGGFFGSPGPGVYCVAVQEDGKILLGGRFTTVNGVARNRIARLNANGGLESTATFNPGTGANDDVYCLAMQADGKILVGGDFTQFNGVTHSGIARLNADGSLDAGILGSNTYTNSLRYGSMVVQVDGKILLAGQFTFVNGVARKGIARLNDDGSLESSSSFDPGTGADREVFSAAVQNDGRILLGGAFRKINDTSRNLAARLSNDAATQTLGAPDATQVRWLRGGAGPEVSQVTFELFVDGGIAWTPLGAGTRIAGGWQLTGLSLPAGGSLRARGRTANGGNGSGLVEQVVTFGSFTPIQQWKLSHLGDSNAPDLADPDHDGLPTLAEYGLVLLPETPSQPPGAGVFAYAEGDRLRMFVPRDPAHNDITVSVEATGNLVAGPWTPLATSTLGAPFTGPGYVGGDDATPGVKTVEVRDLVNLSTTTQRWLRVKVMH